MHLARRLAGLAVAVLLAGCDPAPATHAAAEVVTFKASGSSVVLHGLLYEPKGPGPFPAVLYNHGSAPGMLNNQAFDKLGPMFAAHGWVFFAPYRRGQGLSADAGSFIGDEISAARARGGLAAAAETMVRLLRTDHLDDQMGALDWLQHQPFVQANRISVMGNSFGGVETLLGAERGGYCAAVDASGGAETWDKAPPLRDLMVRTVNQIQVPVLFFQAMNDYDVSPSKTLYAAMKAAGKTAELHIYPPYGTSDRDGHSFAYLGASTWGPDVLQFLGRHCS